MIRAVVYAMRDRARFLAAARNPWALVFDRLGLLKREYVVRMRNGLRIVIRPGTSDRFTLIETLVYDAYRLADFDWLNSDSVVVDVGANIGCFALALSARYGRQIKIHCLEPAATPFDRLTRNIRGNRMDGMVAHRLAIAGHQGTIRLFHGSKDVFNSVFAEVAHSPSETDAEEVRCTTFGTFRAEHKLATIDLLKLDCEGGEYFILNQLTDEAVAGIRAIVCEFHAVPGFSERQTLDHLRSLGFTAEGSGVVLLRRVAAAAAPAHAVAA